ncbi:hypothetical protein Ddc_03926 [Ditylenchus destructor]|nr:hypothetical protein Ddc_03926 [Ditylenchus destructor]
MTMPVNVKNNSSGICRWFQVTIAECPRPLLLSRCAYSSLQLFNVYIEALFNIFPYVDESIGECLSPTLPPEPPTTSYWVGTDEKLLAGGGLLANLTTDENSDGTSTPKNGGEKRYMHKFVSAITILLCIIV